MWTKIIIFCYYFYFFSLIFVGLFYGNSISQKLNYFKDYRKVFYLKVILGKLENKMAYFYLFRIINYLYLLMFINFMRYFYY